LGLTLAAASQLVGTIVFNSTQGSQSLALGLTLAAASQLVEESQIAGLTPVGFLNSSACTSKVLGSRAAKQRPELSPGRGFASLGLRRKQLSGAAERRPHL